MVWESEQLEVGYSYLPLGHRQYRRATYFQGYKISWIIGNLLQRGIFVDKFSMMKVVINIVTREQNI